MNPYYGTMGELNRVQAFKDLITMTNRWKSQFIMWQDTRDKDYLVFGSSRPVPKRFKMIAYTDGFIPANVHLVKSTPP